MFKVNIHVIDPATNAESVVPCGSYSATANDNSGIAENPASCTASLVAKPDEYVYRNWTTGSVNLQKFVVTRSSSKLSTMIAWSIFPSLVLMPMPPTARVDMIPMDISGPRLKIAVG